MAFKTKRKKVDGTSITNSTTQHSDGRIRHTKSTTYGNTKISTSRNTNGSMRVTKTQKTVGGFTHRTQKTYGTPYKNNRRKSSGGGGIGLLGFFGIILLLGILWLNENFPVFTSYLLWFFGGLLALAVSVWLIWTAWIFRYVIGFGAVISLVIYLYSKYL
jgi:hypothetical protein